MTDYKIKQMTLADVISVEDIEADVCFQASGEKDPIEWYAKLLSEISGRFNVEITMTIPSEGFHGVYGSVE